MDREAKSSMLRIGKVLTGIVYAIFIVYIVILVGFALVFRHRLVLSPEEEYALSGGTHGDPQAEGYDAMETEVFGDKG